MQWNLRDHANRLRRPGGHPDRQHLDDHHEAHGELLLRRGELEERAVHAGSDVLDQPFPAGDDQLGCSDFGGRYDRDRCVEVAQSQAGGRGLLGQTDRVTDRSRGLERTLDFRTEVDLVRGAGLAGFREELTIDNGVRNALDLNRSILDANGRSVAVSEAEGTPKASPCRHVFCLPDLSRKGASTDVNDTII